MTPLESWLDGALRDVDRRQLPALRPLLEGLARLTAVLRDADWNEEATGSPESSVRHDR